VDAFPEDATPDGVVGLAGNAAEWVATLADRRDVPKAGPQDADQVVVRGGSFRSRESECGTTFRRLVNAGRAAEHVGFRCVLDDAEYRRRTRTGTDER
jgi:formylglycine-generating enzyme required for sulfatase activity